VIGLAAELVAARDVAGAGARSSRVYFSPPPGDRGGHEAGQEAVITVDTDKRTRVLLALAEAARAGRELSDRRVARDCGVSQPFVSKLRRKTLAVPRHQEEQTVPPDNEPLKTPDTVGEHEGDEAIATTPPPSDDALAAVLLPGALSPPSVLEVTGGPGAGDHEGDQSVRGADLDALSWIENELPVFAEPGGEAVHERISDQAPAVAPDEAASADPTPSAPETGDERTLVESVVDDEHDALTRRLHQQQADHVRLIELVAQGKAETGEITRSRGRIRETKDGLEDLAALRAHQAQVKAARAARTKVERYYQVVDQTEAALAQALDAARAIDTCLEELGVTVAKFRAYLPACDALNHAALTTGGRRLLDEVSIWSSQRASLESEIVARLLALRVLTHRGVAPASQEQPIVVAVRSWTTKLIAVARARGPVIVEDSGGEEPL